MESITERFGHDALAYLNNNRGKLAVIEVDSTISNVVVVGDIEPDCIRYEGFIVGYTDEDHTVAMADDMPLDFIDHAGQRQQYDPDWIIVLNADSVMAVTFS